MDKGTAARWMRRICAALTLTGAAGLILQAVRVFRMGWSRDNAASALMQLAPLGLAWLISLIAAASVQPALRREEQRVIPAERDPAARARLILYALAILLVILGVMNGGMRDVLVKAINICTECIGLG